MLNFIAYLQGKQKKISEISHGSFFFLSNSSTHQLTVLLAGCKLKSLPTKALQLNRLRFSPKPKKTFSFSIFFFFNLKMAKVEESEYYILRSNVKNIFLFTQIGTQRIF